MDLVLPHDGSPKRLPFYLAQEEWLAAKYPDRDFFFLWQVEPTVIIGRNQILDREVNVGFCRSHGIDIVRRRSGGGAVMADMNNVMLSYVTSSTSVEATFSAYTSAVAASLRRLGLDASDNSRNDILIAGRKVSGNSYYHLPGRSIVHGTMLYDCDPELMRGALTPPQVKLRSHGVESVRSRVTTVRKHLPSLSIGDFKAHLSATVPQGGGVMRLSAGDIAEIERLALRYRAKGWLEGRKPRGVVENTERIDKVGTITVTLTVKNGLISDFNLTGDYLETADAQKLLSEALHGVGYDHTRIATALRNVRLEEIIPGLTPSRLVRIMI